MYDIINKIRNTNSTKEKVNILKQHVDNKLLRQILSMTYDKVVYSYGITLKTIEKPTTYTGELTLKEAIDKVTHYLVNEEVRGLAANRLVNKLLKSLNEQDSEILYCLIGRDLKLGMNVKSINKAIPNLITSPPYMRCSILTEKTVKRIKFPAYLQVKLDGTYTTIIVHKGSVRLLTRSGHEDNKATRDIQAASKLPDGAYIGEMLVEGISDRAEANGLINSDNPPVNKIYMVLWDFIPLKEFYDPKHTKNIVQTRMSYGNRMYSLYNIIKGKKSKYLRLVKTKIVKDMEEVLTITKQWIEEGEEGAVLKSKDNIFKDHTSPTQLKIKVKFSIDVRVTGFIEGRKNTKRTQTFGALTYSTDDGKITGSVSGFSDSELKEISGNRDYYIGKIMEIEGNNITKAQNSNTYAISHPRFIEFRFDKDSTDTIDRAFESLKNCRLI